MHYEVLKIPLIKQAIALAAANSMPLKFFGSPWAPPAWMTAQVC
jgi:O-glycosyl hydrolase